MKRHFSLSALLLFLCGSIWAQQINFDDWFENKTMRYDYFHPGTAGEEHFAMDRIVNDGPWAGSLTKLTDPLNFGPYFFEVHDAETDQLLYSRGFASVFGEWQSIPEAKNEWSSFHESVRFPWPKNPVTLIVKKRDGKNNFNEVYRTEIDPASRKVNPAPLPKEYETWDLMVNGPAQEKVDIVILGDGYTAEEMDKFHADIERLTAELFKVEPFKSRKNDFNVRAVETPAGESGVNKPHPGVFRRTPLSMSYSAFDSERYALTYDNRAVRDAASHVPYEFMYILVNEKTYGGGGIYRLYATVATDNKFSDYIFIHEFGHHFAALADEYYTSAVSYEMQPPKVEPWEANITALFNPDELKWKHLVKEGTPIPTPWNKEEFDAFSMEIQKERKQLRAAKVPESEVEALFIRQRDGETKMIEQEKYKGKVGAYEGGGYLQYGMYRPYLDCIMYSRNSNDFCPVCQDAISRVIDQYTK